MVFVGPSKVIYYTLKSYFSIGLFFVQVYRNDSSLSTIEASIFVSKHYCIYEIWQWSIGISDFLILFSLNQSAEIYQSLNK